MEEGRHHDSFRYLEGKVDHDLLLKKAKDFPMVMTYSDAD